MIHSYIADICRERWVIASHNAGAPTVVDWDE
ncbi:hypothetical protein DP63_1059 [Burkholderia pseudomallei MSHR5855]|nr:hypothetical protein DP63_1059 [Burkholderia pseudomallei MSHR5855]AIP41223.1 hypothetical protein DP65_2168 [Burkholderia pseudomallei MSHR5848]